MSAISRPVTIEVSELRQRDPASHVLLDCRFSLADHSAGARQFASGHLPGAFRMDMENDLAGRKGRHGGRHPLPAAEDFSTLLQSCGVSADTTVIIYDDNRLAGAARAWWLLDYFGHRDARVLNGGIAAWRRAGGSLSTDPPPSHTIGSFAAVPDATKVVDYPALRARLSGDSMTLVDSRELARYLGQEEPIDPIAGRIPGALHYCWLDTTDSDGKLLPLEAQRDRWATLPPNPPPIVYCGSGVTAAVNLLSLRLAGVDDASLYAGSWSDWCSHSDSPRTP